MEKKETEERWLIFCPQKILRSGGNLVFFRYLNFYYRVVSQEDICIIRRTDGFRKKSPFVEWILEAHFYVGLFWRISKECDQITPEKLVTKGYIFARWEALEVLTL